MHVLILHDRVDDTARADERDALVQADLVAAVLGELGHTVVAAGVGLDLDEVARLIRRESPTVVFNLVESLAGHGQLAHVVPALLDSLGVPYTGNPTEAHFLTGGKVLAKQWLARHDVATPPWFTPDALTAGPRVPAGRYIIKSVWEHASLGLDDGALVDVTTAAELADALARRAPDLGGEAFAELYVDGREFNLALLAGADGPLLLPPAEIDFVNYPPGKPRVVGYAAKWAEDSFEYRHTPRRFTFEGRDASLLVELARTARRCWDVCGLDGYARVDFRVDRAGRPWVLEVNTNPCLSPDAGFAAAAAEHGLSPADVVARLLAAAQRRRPAAPR